MKKVLFYILAVFPFISCTKMLEEDVRSQADFDYLNSPAGFEDAVKGAYSSLRNFYATERGMSLTVFGTDTYTNGSDGAFKYLNQYTPALDARDQNTRDVWNEFYVAINTCNTAIDLAPQLSALSTKTRNTRTAEARFLRAHYYFVLAQMFGPVPLPLKGNKDVVTEAVREPLTKVYAAIIEDLDFAVANLEVKPADYGRATKPAAEHLLARVYLTKATSSAKAPDDYTKALENAKKVINTYSFKLLPDFAKVFEQGSSEKNDEVIWSVQYTNDPRTNSTGNNAHVLFLMEYDVLPGMQRDVENGRPFKRFKPTDFTLNTLFADRVNDTRYDKSFKVVFFANNAVNIPKNPNGTPKFQVGDTAFWLPGVEVPTSFINSRSYTVYPPSRYTERVYPSLVKFLDPLRPDRGTFEGSRDFLAFRLAETYLIAAEAAMYTGDNVAAAGFINSVRLRSARVGPDPVQNAAYRAAMTVTPAQISIDIILNERGRELLGEQFRWFDLVRTNKLIDRVKAHNPQAAANIKNFHVLRPIPQDQIDRTTNKLDQNPGYLSLIHI